MTKDFRTLCFISVWCKCQKTMKHLPLLKPQQKMNIFMFYKVITFPAKQLNSTVFE